jgi:hypothetical protein
MSVIDFPDMGAAKYRDQGANEKTMTYRNSILQQEQIPVRVKRRVEYR